MFVDDVLNNKFRTFKVFVADFARVAFACGKKNFFCLDLTILLFLFG